MLSGRDLGVGRDAASELGPDDDQENLVFCRRSDGPTEMHQTATSIKTNSATADLVKELRRVDGVRY